MDREIAPGHSPQRRQASTQKPLRTVLLAILFHTYWPKRLSRQEISTHLGYFYGENSRPALYRDLQTLTGVPVEGLPEPDSPDLAEWCEAQRRGRRLAITYDRQSMTFGLAQSFFELHISEEEARAFVALQEGFAPGVPYAEAVQSMLRRWEWQFDEKSRQLVRQKRKRHARPVLLPLSPVVDYSQHNATILLLDQALEEGAYISFAYTPLAQPRDAEPARYQHVEPYELEYRDGHWYFTGFIADLNVFLDFRVDRIRPGTARKEPDRFTPGLRHRTEVKIRYWVSPTLARHGSLSARLREQHVTMLDNDQGAIVEGYARSVWWARRLLLGYGEQVKALGPEELVAAMRESVEAMGKLYMEEK
jgi:predicted DNA-binding transcriptional regulator YafY